jgi:hypothetical protein
MYTQLPWTVSAASAAWLSYRLSAPFKHQAPNMITKTTQHRVAIWLNGRCVSNPALTVALWLSFGIKHSDVAAPRNPAEFQECVDLLAAVPQLRSHMKRMAKLSGAWKVMVEGWAAIEAKLLEEAGLPRCPVAAAMIRNVDAAVPGKQ